MKHIVYVLCVLIVVFGLSSASVAFAEIPSIVSAPIRVDFSELNALWFEALSYLENQEWHEANLKLLDLNQKKYQVGLSNLSVHSSVLLRNVQELQRQGNKIEAGKMLESARLLSPDVPAVYFASARFRFAQNFTNVYGVGRELLRGFLLKFSDIYTILTYANNTFSSVLAAGFLTAIAFILFSFIYYRRAVFFQFNSLFPFELPSLVGHLVGWTLFVFVTLGIGIFWGVLLLALFLLWQVDLVSKRLLQLFFFLGTLLTVGLFVICMTFYAFNGEYFQALRDISCGQYSSRSVTVLKAYLQEHPEDSYALFGLAYIAQKTGRLEDAVSAYEEIAAQYPDQAIVQNNLGNTYQRFYRSTKERAWYQKAEQAYRSAIYYAPKKFEIRYNYGRFLLLEFQNSESADSELQVARNLDKYRFSMYSENLRDSVDTIDMPFSTLALLKKLSTKDSLVETSRLAGQFWASGSRFNNPWYFSITCAALLVLSFFVGAKKGSPQQSVRYCQMCGDPYRVKKRKKAQESQAFCTQCTYIFKKKTVVKPEKRQAKVKQIQLRQKTRGILSKVLSFCVPGAGQMYLGYPKKGTLLTFLFFLAVSVLALKGLLRVLVDPTGVGLSLVTMIVFLLLLVGIYLFNVYDILRLSPKNQ